MNLSPLGWALVGLVILLVGLLVFVHDRRRPPPGFPTEPLKVIPDAGEVERLKADIAALNTQLGQERADHRANVAAVQQQALVDVQQAKAEMQLEFAEKKRSEAKNTAARSRVSLVAKISEHIAPLLEGFPYNFKEARWFGEIFDFLVFEGLEEGFIRQVVFVEVKTSRSGRVSNPREKALRDAIKAGRVSYEVFVPDVASAKKDGDETQSTRTRRTSGAS